MRAKFFEMATPGLLFGDDPRGKDFTKKLHHQQGLLQIYEDFCLEDDSACANCPFPERLKEWS